MPSSISLFLKRATPQTPSSGSGTRPNVKDRLRDAFLGPAAATDTLVAAEKNAKGGASSGADHKRGHGEARALQSPWASQWCNPYRQTNSTLEAVKNMRKHLTSEPPTESITANAGGNGCDKRLTPLREDEVNNYTSENNVREWALKGVGLCHTLAFWTPAISRKNNPETIYREIGNLATMMPENPYVEFWLGFCALWFGYHKTFAVAHLEKVLFWCPGSRHARVYYASALLTKMVGVTTKEWITAQALVKDVIKEAEVMGRLDVTAEILNVSLNRYIHGNDRVLLSELQRFEYIIKIYPLDILSHAALLHLYTKASWLDAARPWHIKERRYVAADESIDGVDVISIAEIKKNCNFGIQRVAPILQDLVSRTGEPCEICVSSLLHRGILYIRGWMEGFHSLDDMVSYYDDILMRDGLVGLIKGQPASERRRILVEQVEASREVKR